jgi:hypothetical protein
LRFEVTNHLDAEGEFRFFVHPTEGLMVEPNEGVLRVAPQTSKSASITVSSPRLLAPGRRQMALTALSPDGAANELSAVVEITSPLAVTVRPVDLKSSLQPPYTLQVEVTNMDDRPTSGGIELRAPDGFAMQPSRQEFAELKPGGTMVMRSELSSSRAVTPRDALTATCATNDGLKIVERKALLPIVVDADGNGLADGWKINPENTSAASGRNAATVSIEPGHSEFLCQKIQCTRFTNGWIILHRDNQDTIVKGRRYRITFSARQEGLDKTGALGVAVYNIKPWQGCGPEEHYRLTNDWQTFSTEFTAKRDSTNARFEFFFTETGTVWIENMRLEQVGK